MVSHPMTYFYVVNVLLFYLLQFFKYRFLAFTFQIIM